MINANPGTGITEAIAGIRYRLSIEDPDALFKNAGTDFQNELSSKANQDFLQYEVINRKSLATENRGQLLELIAEWGTARDSLGQPKQSAPAFREYFERLWKQGYKFSTEALEKLTPEDRDRIRKLAYGQGFSSKLKFATESSLTTDPAQLAVPYTSIAIFPTASLETAESRSPKSPKLVGSSIVKTAKEAVATAVDRTAEVTAATTVSKTDFRTKFDPRNIKFGEIKWKSGGSGSANRNGEGFALLSDEDDSE
ncbi:hypothetical protein HK100_010879 [Physocladia obscura]|uniref:VHS domain-containing protein n=1 Tax=Physocladia obscura TaxID=109957 RepID=A0AAD5XEI3_9FUNG|nr:hypothetical protein HK100_010879 [Physocladia obscura]